MKALTLALGFGLAFSTAFAGAAENLPQPARVWHRPAGSVAAVKLAALRYAAFWNSGDPRYAELALTPTSSTALCPPAVSRAWPGPCRLRASSAPRCRI